MITATQRDREADRDRERQRWARSPRRAAITRVVDAVLCCCDCSPPLLRRRRGTFRLKARGCHAALRALLVASVVSLSSGHTWLFTRGRAAMEASLDKPFRARKLQGGLVSPNAGGTGPGRPCGSALHACCALASTNLVPRVRSLWHRRLPVPVPSALTASHHTREGRRVPLV